MDREAFAELVAKTAAAEDTTELEGIVKELIGHEAAPETVQGLMSSFAEAMKDPETAKKVVGAALPLAGAGVGAAAAGKGRRMKGAMAGAGLGAAGGIALNTKKGLDALYSVYRNLGGQLDYGEAMRQAISANSAPGVG